MSRTKVARYSRHIQFFEVDGYEQDEGGNLVPKWQPFKKKWCNVKFLSGINQEEMESGANTASKRVRLSMRYTEEITEDMCFEVNHNLFNVKSAGDMDGLMSEVIVFGEVDVDGGRN